ncbi:cell division protein ZipA [Methyloglobulus morosus KoM1]|uniref:Cell division protein ZipA n=1 Tax=Methyloglobulus morosus KoM1 TaxID=1116472 RepID=V5C6I9_9GAMM|nr:cell division protein ZipA C-terminal FtsZ-binding domain-containing protein [Methyloglobulus morosus]ESS72378.1 cell division protein ZipA [Methyloglobulus morosus KoM1]
MDKELLRIVIIATGFVVIIGMILWSYIKNRNAMEDEDSIESEKVIGSSGAISDALKLHTEHDDFDIVPVGSAKRTLDSDDNESDWDTEFDGDDEMESDTRNVLPEILQFGVVASDDEGFNGVELVLVFESVGLEYGDMKVYERINKQGDVDFGVACMVEPGTFPDGEYLASFNCPGIVFYLQHQDLEDAQNVFDDFVDTIKTVAKELDGVIWDHQRQPLTDETIQAIRRSL